MIFLDGLGGDALGETGFDRIPHIHSSTPEFNRMLIGQAMITDAYDHILQTSKWPSATTIRAELLNYIELLPSGANQAELAFLLLRTRRTIGPWAQQMLPAGHVAVCPYLDLPLYQNSIKLPSCR